MSTQANPVYPPETPSLHGCSAQGLPHPLLLTVFHDWTRFTSDSSGRCTGEETQGLYCANTLFLSRHQYLVNGHALKHALSYQTASNSWYLSGALDKSGDQGNLPEGKLPKGCLGIAIQRHIDGGMADFVRVTNYDTSSSRDVQFTLEISCPIIDREEAEEMKTSGRAPANSRIRGCRSHRNGLDLRFERTFGRRRNTPSRELHALFHGHPPRAGASVVRALSLLCRGEKNVHFSLEKGNKLRIHAKIHLQARAHVDLKFFFDFCVDGQEIKAPRRLAAFSLPEETSRAAPGAPRFRSSHAGLDMLVGQALADLHSLKLGYLNGKQRSERPISAGIPRYIGIFARDTLITGWQSAAFDPELLKGAVVSIGELQGKEFKPWRDEEPGRLPHERRRNPLSEIGEKNRELYYGDVTSTPFYCAALFTHYKWSGDLRFLKNQEPVLRGCCDWILRRLEEGAGFIYYSPATSSRAGANRNQAWKDSGDAIVDDQGGICVPPLALVEIQGYAYEALLRAAMLYRRLGDSDYADRLRDRAGQLKRDFNKKFWDSRRKRFALALQRAGETRIMTEASNIGHCIGTGLLEEKRVPGVVKRLLSREMFSGWGIRTLASSNPAYDPFSYHRGSVWPVENAEIAEEMRKAGHWKAAEQVISAQLALAGFFQSFRLPEVVTGQARSDFEPLPGLYPKANMLQAWSSSAALQFVQALLGLDADASKRTLKVGAHLPEWVERIELDHLRVGKDTVSLVWERHGKHTRVKVKERSPGFRVIRSS